MIRLKLIIIGVMLSMVAAYSTPIGIPPTVTKITNLSSTSFTVNWTPASITGLSTGANYFISYSVTVTGPGGSLKNTNSTSIAFSGLMPSTYYSIKIQTYAQIIGEAASVNFAPVVTSVYTSEAPILEINTVSTDYTQQSPKSVTIQAKTRIIFANGFHYKATNGYSLVTQLLPNTKSSNEIDDYTVYPECYYLEVDKQNSSEVLVYEIMQPQQGSLLIRNKDFDYNVVVKSEYFEIVEMNTGRISKRGNLLGYETQIDVADLKGGFYIVKVANGKQVYTQKIAIRN